MKLRRRVSGFKFLLLATAAQLTAAIFGVSILVSAIPATAAQTVPYKINFQGRLTDNSGNALTDGLYNVKFRLWNAITLGTNVWEGDRTITATDHRVQVTSGLFNIQFGDTGSGDPALSPALFSNGTYPLYLEVELPTPVTSSCATNACAVFTEGAMTPRQALASAPYAFSADTLDGLDSTAFGQLSASNTFTSANTFTPASGVGITVQAAAATHSLDIKDSGGIVQAYVDAAGILNVAQTIQATAGTVDLGTATSSFRTGYFGTSVQTPAINATTSGGTITTNLGTLQRTSTGTTTIDLKDLGNTTLSVTNSGGGVAGISASGGLTIGTGKAVTVGAAVGQTSSVACTTNQAVTTATFTGGVLTTAPVCATISGTGATTSLNNVAATSISAALVANTNNAQNIGSAAIVWQNVFTGNLDTGTTTTALTIGTALTTTAITIGRSTVAVSLPGGITTSGGTINTGSGAITTTGPVTGASFTGSGSGLTALNPSNFVTGSAAVTLQPAAGSSLTLTTPGAGAINLTPGLGGIVTALDAGETFKVNANITPTVDLVAIGNLAGQEPTAAGINPLQLTWFTKPAAGNTSSAQRINLTNNNTVTAGQARGLHIVATGAGGAVNSDTVGILIDPLLNSSTGTTNQHAIEIGASWNSGIYVSSGGNTIAATSSTALLITNAAALAALTVDTSANKVQIGSATSDTNQVLLQLDSFSTFADIAGCTTSNNQGALYYNTTSNAVRGCVGGNWEDVVTTSGLGLITYGVVPDSGSGGGDLTSVANLGVSGPCKVSFVTTTTVKIAQGCTAYSGGRKIIIPDNTTPTGILNFANNSFTHVCLNGVNNQPAFSASGTEAANLPTFSVNNPVLCLADIRTTPNVLASIYDVRTFTTTDKSFGTLNATTGFLGASIAQGAAGLVSLSSVASQTGLRGVVVATQGSVAVSNTPNMIVALRGPQFVKSLATSTVGGFLQTTTTAGYTSTAAISNTGYSVIGTAQRTIDTLCTLASNCQFSQLVDINIR